ncbi:DUF2971 domain-containing protein [Pseudomonas chlororaphis]|uniref:DUF2971 domain-containing protein n=1 Tax=Pseudomonas chlororaphis TaxID=587753 RepID=UPI0006A58850|nr:DUF2971 domain-containing protein [Pseudomonas chlororaphis]AZC30894.1 hypothetical protein C4K38_2934 [Pseudomonas chlororaphis subsp. piscium]WDG78431.1 DUF2971 domain-containing protein [Pseudomonas chlororaphis]WDG88518.1 DUF2971 domain-containing protein [Pseudomonas chlororaphis]WDG94774.1 DUF2971 domain-containing protein [Pseudomonas chlororaphis]SDT06233.1 Protein of unknown function [Pseudomonas chlororaphis]
MVKDDSKQPLTCFKYRSGESALRCLEEGTLYFAKPGELNDALEAKFDHVDLTIYNKIVGDTLSEISQKRGGPALAFDNQGLPDLAKATEKENERFRNSCNEVGIFSAARRPNHQAMWAYYAENNQGVCFELEWSASTLEDYQLIPVEVTYTDAARVHNSGEDWRALFLDLAEKTPNATLAELQELSLEEDFRRRRGILSTARVTSIKHTDWAHEKEIRLLAPKAGARTILSTVLKKVHFIRMDGEKFGPIMQHLHLNYPQVQIVQWMIHHGTVTTSAKNMMLRSIPIKDI